MTDATTTAFANYQWPGLKDGIYTVTAQIVVDPKVPNPATFPTVSKTLQVGSDDVSLPPGSIVSVFPPENKSGDYANYLPHAVLNNPTLPWQRRLFTGQDDNRPWMALLLLTDADLKPGGDATVTPGVTPRDLATLRLPLAKFRELAPSPDEATFLTHVRKVKSTNKADGVTEEDYAVVIGNRLPPQEKTATAFLVSLAGLGDSLPGSSGKTPADPVVLKVLASWRFFTIKEPASFADVIFALDRDHPTLRLPVRPGGDAATEDVLAKGYVPLPHSLRVGGSTVSWYRGPCVPYPVTRTLSALPAPWADAVAFYDPDRGMLDVSCAGAWTLGRLLALNAGSFAAALYNWKRTAQRDTIDRKLHELDTGTTAPAFATPGRAHRDGAEHALATHLAGAFAALTDHNGAPVAAATPSRPVAMAAAAAHATPTAGRISRAQNLHEAMTDHVQIAQHHHSKLQALAVGETSETVDPRVQLIWSWLGDLNLLKPVPLHYLVPDPRMLPPESVRFFCIDQSWMEALVDGALSIGRVTASDHSHDKVFHRSFHEGGVRAAASARQKQKQRGLVAAADEFPPLPERPASGFFLRSSAVVTWPRMEVTAGAKGEVANILRMEALGTLMICLFDKVIDVVTLHPPSEGIHFGFDEVNHKFTKNRRRLKGQEAGSEILDAKDPIDPLTLDQAQYRDPAGGILNIGAIASWFVSHLGDDAKPFTSAEFAVEMVAGVEAVQFTFPGGQPPKEK